jgi:hypothetical protein
MYRTLWQWRDYEVGVRGQRHLGQWGLALMVATGPAWIENLLWFWTLEMTAGPFTAGLELRREPQEPPVGGGDGELYYLLRSAPTPGPSSPTGRSASGAPDRPS